MCVLCATEPVLFVPFSLLTYCCVPFPLRFVLVPAASHSLPRGGEGMVSVRGERLMQPVEPSGSSLVMAAEDFGLKSLVSDV